MYHFVFLKAWGFSEHMFRLSVKVEIRAWWLLAAWMLDLAQKNLSFKPFINIDVFWYHFILLSKYLRINQIWSDYYHYNYTNPDLIKGAHNVTPPKKKKYKKKCLFIPVITPAFEKFKQLWKVEILGYPNQVSAFRYDWYLVLYQYLQNTSVNYKTLSRDFFVRKSDHVF